MSTTTTERRKGSARKIFYGLLPLVLLAIVLAAFLGADPIGDLSEGVPPVEELTIDRVVLETNPRQMVVEVTNGGPSTVTIAQVLVDEAYWDFDIDDRELERLASTTITIPYPWVSGEAHEVVLISATGVTFAHEVEVALETPTMDGATLWNLAVIGFFVGVVPVFLGLGWFPFVRRLDGRWVAFLLAVTAGLLVFLAIDALDESVELAQEVPGAFQGIGLVAMGIATAVAVLYGLDAWLRRRRGGEVTPLFVAAMIAVGIGLHNLGEGLAIGAAFAIGEVGLTTFLVVGFILHNVTEGLGIVSPLARSRPTVLQLVGLGLVAGAPAIFGTWIGGFAFSPVLATLFLGAGVGAILQVVWEIRRFVRSRAEEFSTPMVATGFIAGMAVMYLTGVMIAA